MPSSRGSSQPRDLISCISCIAEDMEKLVQSCLRNLMDRGVWQAIVHGVTKVGHDGAMKQYTYIQKTTISHHFY